MFRNNNENTSNDELVDFSRYPENTHDNIKKYIETLSELDIIALKIARKNLESSFNIIKCIGYQKWLKNNL